MHRRTISILTGAAALALAVSGCSGPTGSDTSTTGSGAAGGETDEAVTISYLNWGANGGHEENLQAIADAFHEENPNITVEIQTVPYDGYFTALQTAIAGGSAPDTFELNYEEFSTYAADGALAELTEVDTSGYVDDLLNGFVYDGKQYGLPEAFQAGILAYNKDLFDAAGVSYPTEDWTWDDAWAAAEKITDPANDVWGLQQPAHFWEFYSTLAAAGGHFFNEDKSAAAFNSPEGLAAFEWLTKKSGVVAPPVNEIAGIPDIESTMFKNGQLGMWQVASGAIAGLRDTQANWDIQIVPALESHTAYAFVDMIGVSSSSAHKEAAEKWAQYFTSADVAIEQRVASSWNLAALKDQSKFTEWLQDAPPANKAAVLLAGRDAVFPPTLTGKQTELQDILNEELTAVTSGTKTAEQAIGDAETRVNDLINR